MRVARQREITEVGLGIDGTRLGKLTPSHKAPKRADHLNVDEMRGMQVTAFYKTPDKDFVPGMGHKRPEDCRRINDQQVNPRGAGRIAPQ